MKKVVKALGNVNTVEIVQTDVPTKTVTLCYDAIEVSMEHIETALREVGHVIAKSPIALTV